MSRISQGYLKDIFHGDIHRSPLISLLISFCLSFSLSIDIFLLIQRYLSLFLSAVYPLHIYLFIFRYILNICLDIFHFIHRYLSSYPQYILCLSIYLSFDILNISFDIFLLIPSSPAIYPAGCLLRFRLARLAAAFRLCIALRKLLCFISAPPGAGLSRPCDPAAGPVGARRRRVRMAGWGPLAGQLGR